MIESKRIWKILNLKIKSYKFNIINLEINSDLPTSIKMV